MLLKVFLFTVLEAKRVPTSLSLSKSQISGGLVTLDHTVDAVKLNESDGSSNLPQASSGHLGYSFKRVQVGESIDAHLYEYERRRDDVPE